MPRERSSGAEVEPRGSLGVASGSLVFIDWSLGFDYRATRRKNFRVPEMGLVTVFCPLTMPDFTCRQCPMEELKLTRILTLDQIQGKAAEALHY
jgi:hypothetical protein